MKIIMTAFLSVKSHRKGILVKEGKAAAMTCGMVSPTMIQKATMPPNALDEKLLAVTHREQINQPTKPTERPKQED